ncbi:MAG TPA: ATP-binding protein [bacterium]|nr:ATP-binding protein [bacterium]
MSRRWINYIVPPLAIILLTAVAYRLFPSMEPINVVMLYLLANVLIAVRYGQGPVIVSTVLSIAAYDYYFVPPNLQFAPEDEKYFLSFFIMFFVILLTSRLAIRSRRSAEKAMAAEMEAEKERMISALLSSVSHDLRTPLATIAGAASTLTSQEGEISAEDRRNLQEVIFRESERLNEHVENLLQITRFEAGGLSLEKDCGSVEEVVGSALGRLRGTLADRKIDVSLPEDLPLVPFDALLMEQVFVNLLDNVAHYTPPGSPVEIRAFCEGKKVTVEVSDRGPGVPSGEHERIFAKFYRRGRPNAPGTGLGLAICRAVIRAHGSEIAVRDREGGGSVFHFSLPLEGGAGAS